MSGIRNKDDTMLHVTCMAQLWSMLIRVIHTISTTKAMGMQQDEKRKDFIGNLPMDITTLIIRLLFTHSNYRQPRKYIMVWTTWWYCNTDSITFNQYNRHCFLDERDNKVSESFNDLRSFGILASHPSINFSQRTTLCAWQAWQFLVRSYDAAWQIQILINGL